MKQDPKNSSLASLCQPNEILTSFDTLQFSKPVKHYARRFFESLKIAKYLLNILYPRVTSIYRSIVFLMLFSSIGYAEQLLPYREAIRLNRIEKILLSIQNVDQEKLLEDQEWARTASSHMCDTELLSIKLTCMMENSRAYCQDKYGLNASKCLLYIDIFAVNALNESMFISSREKYHMLKNTTFHKNIFQEKLQYRYGELATAFAMSEYFVCGLEREKCFAAGLDSFCREFSDKGRLPYQACLGALISFTATHLD